MKAFSVGIILPLSTCQILQQRHRNRKQEGEGGGWCGHACFPTSGIIKAETEDAFQDFSIVITPPFGEWANERRARCMACPEVLWLPTHSYRETKRSRRRTVVGGWSEEESSYNHNADCWNVNKGQKRISFPCSLFCYTYKTTKRGSVAGCGWLTWEKLKLLRGESPEKGKCWVVLDKVLLPLLPAIALVLCILFHRWLDPYYY